MSYSTQAIRTSSEQGRRASARRRVKKTGQPQVAATGPQSARGLAEADGVVRGGLLRPADPGYRGGARCDSLSPWCLIPKRYRGGSLDNRPAISILSRSRSGAAQFMVAISPTVTTSPREGEVPSTSPVHVLRSTIIYRDSGGDKPPEHIAPILISPLLARLPLGAHCGGGLAARHTPGVSPPTGVGSRS